MILRKPYAFLIKHFRLLHLIILGCLTFFLFNMSSLHSLFSKLQDSGTYTYLGATSYITNFIYLILVIAFLITIVLYVLLKRKNKPYKIYFFMMLYFLITIGVYIYLYSYLKILDAKTITVDQIIVLNDISFAITIPAYLFMVVSFIRGIGFNLKQFNFSKDAEALDIADKDSEEFEFIIGQNNYRYLRKIRRTIREMKYYIIENKFSIITIAISTFVIIIGIGIFYYNQHLKRLSSSETTSVNGIMYQVVDSYLTNYDYYGNEVNSKHKYVIVNMKFYNTSNITKYVDLTKIFLYDGSTNYLPNTMYNEKFYDLGVPYVKDSLIASNTGIERTLCFELPKTTTKKNYELRVQYDIGTGILKDYVAEYKKFDINCKSIDKKNQVFEKNINDTLTVDELGVNEFMIHLKDYSIEDTYENKYVTCKSTLECGIKSTVISSKLQTNETMLIVNYEGNIYSSANFSKTLNTYNKIFNAYTEIKYTLYGKEYSEKSSVVESDVDKKVFIKVSRKITNADNIKLVFHFRNDIYEIELL